MRTSMNAEGSQLSKAWACNCLVVPNGCGGGQMQWDHDGRRELEDGLKHSRETI